MRILCLDIGTKRIGAAVSDPFGWTAQSLCVIIRKDFAYDLGEIERLIKETEAKLLLVGLPLNAEGEIGPEAKKIQTYALKIKSSLENNGIDIPMEFWDERYSTADAQERLIEADLSRKRRKEIIDKMAAAVILDSYLRAHETNSQNSEGTEG